MPQPGVPERRKGIATTELMVNGPADGYVERTGAPFHRGERMLPAAPRPANRGF